jgi:3-phenylpropionate/trans-cinnamate dioxygenase ferredoxin subunit
MAEWTTAAKTPDLPEGEKVGVAVEGEDVLVANVGGEYRAVGATCTHAGCNLADDGDLENGSVSCICHGSEFDLASGEAIGPPADEPLTVYQVRLEGDEIQIAPPG